MVLVPVFDNAAKGIVIGGTVVTLVGLLDDLIDITPLLKFLGQLVAIAVAVYFDLRVTRLSIPFTDVVYHLPEWLSILFTSSG